MRLDDFNVSSIKTAIGPATATLDPRPATRDPRPATRDY